MAVRITPERLGYEVLDVLNKYHLQLIPVVNDAMREVAKDTANNLKKAGTGTNGSYKDRAGTYSKDWTYQTDPTRRMNKGAKDFVVYNKKHYQLSHLLENGHVSRNGRRTNPYKHISPAEAKAQEEAISKVKEAIERAGY